ncbi:MAG TPA: type II toxin-antitoxin system RelE/ParE family toxin [Opitutaceae bacterium]|nr:type II toxin-antitoxin system RelE/ParE family toxin [Opitutaceae bacterium]
MAAVIWSEPALLQLDEIASYIALDKPDAARAVVRRIFEATDHLARFKKMGQKIPELPHSSYRQVWIQPCWIYYRINGDDIHILHVRRAEQSLRIGHLIEGD